MSSRTDWTSTGKTWAFKDESSQPIIYQVSSIKYTLAKIVVLRGR